MWPEFNTTTIGVNSSHYMIDITWSPPIGNYIVIISLVPQIPIPEEKGSGNIVYNELCQTQECGATNQIASFVISVTSHDFVHIIYTAQIYTVHMTWVIIIEFHWHNSLYTMLPDPFLAYWGLGHETK